LLLHQTSNWYPAHGALPLHSLRPLGFGLVTLGLVGRGVAFWVVITLIGRGVAFFVGITFIVVVALVLGADLVLVGVGF